MSAGFLYQSHYYHLRANEFKMEKLILDATLTHTKFHDNDFIDMVYDNMTTKIIEFIDEH
jgi:nitrous oxidase accessory protein NosD